MNPSSRLSLGVWSSVLSQRHSTGASDGLAVASANPRLGDSSQISLFLHEGDNSHVVPKPETQKWPCPEAWSCVEVPWGDTQMSIVSCHCSAPQLPPQETNKGPKSYLNISEPGEACGLFSHLAQVVCLPPEKPSANLIPYNRFMADLAS